MKKKPPIAIIGIPPIDHVFLLKMKQAIDKISIPTLIFDKKDDKFLTMAETILKLEDFKHNEIYKSKDNK